MSFWSSTVHRSTLRPLPFPPLQSFSTYNIMPSRRSHQVGQFSSRRTRSIQMRFARKKLVAWLFLKSCGKREMDLLLNSFLRLVISATSDTIHRAIDALWWRYSTLCAICFQPGLLSPFCSLQFSVEPAHGTFSELVFTSAGRSARGASTSTPTWLPAFLKTMSLWKHYELNLKVLKTMPQR